MVAVYQTKAACEDLLSLWLYIAENNSPISADKIYERFEQAFILLSNYPELGRIRNEIAPEARSLIAERWLVLYRIVASDVQIVRVIDGARDIGNIDWAVENDPE